MTDPLTIAVERTIDAPPGSVFRALAMKRGFEANADALENRMERS